MADLVSIITPTYNAERTIAATIESVLAQTYADWEMVITDDCSQDATVEIIRRYADKDSRIRLICKERNSGAGECRNRSISHASGRYIAFLDADDRWLPTKLEKQIAFMRETGCKASYTSYLTCDAMGNLKDIVPCPKSVAYRDIIRDDRMGCLTFVYDAEALGKVYMPLMRRRQDWAMKILVLQKAGEALGYPETLALYRVAEGSLSNGGKMSLVRYNVAVYRDTLHYGSFAAWMMFLFVFMPHYIYKRVALKIINNY